MKETTPKWGTCETEFGEKIWVEFDYNEGLIQDIKALPWEKTHRAWNDEEKRWEFDRDKKAIELFEEYTKLKVPTQYKPNNTSNQTITLVVPENYTWFFVNDATEEIDEELDKKFSYEKPGAKYSDKYKRGEWDGKVHLYSKKHNGAPVGLLKKAEEHLIRLGYNVNIVDRRKDKGLKRDFEWNFEKPLRGYQKEAVLKAKERERGIICFPTGAGKTLTSLRLIYELEERAIIMVHTKELLYQWEEKVENFLGVSPGLIGDGQWEEGPVTIVVMQTLMSRGVDELDEGYGLLFFDECHRTSAADRMNDIGMDIDTKKRFGLSATPWRRVSGEELKIEGAIGEKIMEVDVETLVEKGYLAQPVFETIEGAVKSCGGDYQEVYRESIVKNRERNKNIVQKAEDLRDEGFKVFIDVKRIDHGERLEDQIENAVFLQGDDDTEIREKVLSRFENQEENFVLISTLLKEGVDLPSMSAIILAGGGKSDISVIQTIGRALRPKNGEKARIVDIKDIGRFIGEHYRERQKTMNNYYGEFYG